jgi:hypothetical protein
MLSKCEAATPAALLFLIFLLKQVLPNFVLRLALISIVYPLLVQ